MHHHPCVIYTVAGLMAASAAYGKPFPVVGDYSARSAHSPIKDMTASLREQLKFDSKMLPGVEAIGAGYDPFAGYASPDYIVSTIFNWTAADTEIWSYHGKEYNKPIAVQALDYSKSELREVYGEDIDTYQKNLATSVSIGGSYKFFSGSLNVEFTEHETRSSHRSFARIQQSVGTWSLQLPLRSNTRDLLNDDFRQVLDTLNVSDNHTLEQFFKTYGSHILTGIVAGGSVVQSSATQQLRVTHDYEVSVAAKQSFSFGLGELSAEEKTSSATHRENFNSHSETITTTQGGDPGLGGRVFTGLETFSTWSASVIQYPRFVDFALQHPFAPIWKLCSADANGQEVAKALKLYFHNVWAPNYSAKLTRQPDYVNQVSIVIGDKADIPPTPGYTKVDVDLNSRTKVHNSYVFLCYHKEEYKITGGNEKAIVDIAVIYNHDPVPDGFVKIPHDLNSGANGADVWLCVKYAEYNPTTALIDITAVNGDSHPDAPYGYTAVPKDLNFKASGDYVYFAYSKLKKNVA